MTAAVEPKMVKGQCPGCNGERRSYVRAEHVSSWRVPEDNSAGDDTYRVLECAGCERIYFQQASSSTYHTEMEFIEEMNDWYEVAGTSYSHYPPTTIRSKPHWLPQVQAQDSGLSKLLEELYEALNIDLSILPAIGARTVFDRASELLGVDSNFSFEKKLDALVVLGKIGREERGVLDVLVQAGSAAAHRGWAPRAKDVATMMDVAESFLKSNFYIRHVADDMNSRVPRRIRPPRSAGRSPRPGTSLRPTPAQLAGPTPVPPTPESPPATRTPPGNTGSDGPSREAPKA